MLVETAVRASVMAAMTAMSGKGGGQEKERGIYLDERQFRRVDKFSGGTGWKEFSFQFRTAVGAAHGKVRGGLEDIIKAGKNYDLDAILRAG